MKIQALYEGTADDLPSASPVLAQSIDRFSTATTLSFTTQLQPSGQLRDILEANVMAIGGEGVAPVGSVVFRRNGRVIGRVQLSNGTGRLTLGRHVPRAGNSSRLSTAARGSRPAHHRP